MRPTANSVVFANADSCENASMAEEPESILLRYLRQIDAKIDRVIEDLHDLKHRITSLENQIAHLHGDFANQSVRIDRIEIRLERIEKRLNLVEA